jgi:tetratricopeptide (TPR) repeat protein
MAIKGSLREAALPDVLQLLAMGKKTGCLGMTHRGNFAHIYFEEGKISFADIVNRPERTGDLCAYVEETVYQLFTWTEGTFNFEVGVVPEHSDRVAIAPESLMLEGARRVDEWTVIERRIHGSDMVFQTDEARRTELESRLTPRHSAVLQYVDGRRDMARIVDATGLSEFDVGKALFELLESGVVRSAGTSSAKKPATSQPVRADEHRNLGVAFYKSNMHDEATREFRRVLELEPNDQRSLFYVGLIHLRQRKWAEAIEAYQIAATQPDAPAGVFHNLALAFQQVGNYAAALNAMREAERRSAGDARIQTSIAALLLFTGDPHAADAALRAAKSLWKRKPATVWYHYAALCAALVGDLARAQELLMEGPEAHPTAAALYNNLGVLLETRGCYDDALAAAEHGLLEDPTLPQLHKNIGDLYYRVSRFDEALAAYERAIRLDEKLGGDMHFKVGNIKLRKQQRDEAAKSWKRALELDPDNAIAERNLSALRLAS